MSGAEFIETVREAKAACPHGRSSVLLSTESLADSYQRK